MGVGGIRRRPAAGEVRGPPKSEFGLWLGRYFVGVAAIGAGCLGCQVKQHQ